MSAHDDDPFEPRDTRPALALDERRESLRTDVEARIVVGDETFATEGNISLGGFFIPAGFPASDLALDTDVICEVPLPERAREPDEADTLRLSATVRPTPGSRPGCFLAFRALDFASERKIARLLDVTSL